MFSRMCPLLAGLADSGGSARSVSWFVSLLVREKVLLASLCERKILFRLEIYDRLRQATAKRTGCGGLTETSGTACMT